MEPCEPGNGVSAGVARVSSLEPRVLWPVGILSSWIKQLKL